MIEDISTREAYLAPSTDIIRLETETWESSDFLDAGEGESFFDKITNGGEQLFHAVHFPGDGAPPRKYGPLLYVRTKCSVHMWT